MVNSSTTQYYQGYWTSGLNPNLSNYIRRKEQQDKRTNLIIITAVIITIVSFIGLSKPIFAKNEPAELKTQVASESIYIEKNFEENIKNKYSGSYINFPSEGIAHVKKIKYINSKPIKINIVELNTKVNPNLKIKPQIAGAKLNSKTTVRKIAQKEDAIIAINGGFFKPQTGVPLGALMVDGTILTGPIYNRVGIAIFENGKETNFRMENIDFDIKAYTKSQIVKIDNINQPRMLKSHTLIYTSDWGEYSPQAPDGGYNALIRENEIIKISANPIGLNENDIVISAPIEIIRKLALDKEITIDIKLSENLKNARHIIGAGPYLIKDSQIYVDYKEQKLQAISGKNPRSAIGYKNDGTFIILTVDGREKDSVGMTLYELANLMKELGCENAMNFDGGSSSALYVKGKIVNSAVNKEGIAVSNALTISEFNPKELRLSSI